LDPVPEKILAKCCIDGKYGRRYKKAGHSASGGWPENNVVKFP